MASSPRLVIHSIRMPMNTAPNAAPARVATLREGARRMAYINPIGATNASVDQPRGGNEAQSASPDTIAMRRGRITTGLYDGRFPVRSGLHEGTSSPAPRSERTGVAIHIGSCFIGAFFRTIPPPAVPEPPAPARMEKAET